MSVSLSYPATNTDKPCCVLTVIYTSLLSLVTLGRPRRRWEDNIKMDLQEGGGGCEDWMELAQDRDRWRALVSTVMNLRGIS